MSAHDANLGAPSFIGQDVLDVEHHPKSTIAGTGVEVLGQHEFRVNGDLTIRRVTRKATLDMHGHGEWATPYWEGGVEKGPMVRAGFVATISESVGMPTSMREELWVVTGWA